jgi:hypothetical protein
VLIRFKHVADPVKTVSGHDLPQMPKVLLMAFHKRSASTYPGFLQQRADEVIE